MRNEQFRVGDIIELVKMPDDPDPIPVGSRGVILGVNPLGFRDNEVQYHVHWDNGRTLMPVTPIDELRLVERIAS